MFYYSEVRNFAMDFVVLWVFGNFCAGVCILWCFCLEWGGVALYLCVAFVLMANLVVMNNL